MNNYDFIKLSNLDEKEQIKALVFVFSNIYIPILGGKINEYNEMITMIKNRFDDKDKIIASFQSFSKAMYRDDIKLYIFKKNNEVLGYYLQYDDTHAITNDDELSSNDQSYFHKLLENIIS